MWLSSLVNIWLRSQYIWTETEILLALYCNTMFTIVYHWKLIFHSLEAAMIYLIRIYPQSCDCFLKQGFPGQQYGSGMGATGPYPGQAMQYHTPGPQRSAPSPSYTGHRMPLQQSNMGQYPAGPGNPGQYYKVKQPWLTYNHSWRCFERFWQLLYCL